VKDRDFEGALIELCGPWLMVRADYADRRVRNDRQPAGLDRSARTSSPPAGLAQLAAGMKQLEVGKHRKLWIVPGVSTQAGESPPDVMRGEETQIYGALTLAERTDGSGLFILPGTHSNWVWVENGSIVWFKTFMTGELFSVLSEHSILGKLMAEGRAARSGRVRARRRHAIAIRSAFVATLLGAHAAAVRPAAATSIADYLSGLLIGHEIYTAARLCAGMNLRHDA
jgi:2-dehydro-3-deoxygalactonokinase